YTGMRLLYEAFVDAYDREAQRMEAAEAGPQYGDYSELFNDLLESEETADGRAYWERTPPIEISALKWPSERRCVDGAAVRPACRPIDVPLDLLRRLDRL